MGSWVPATLASLASQNVRDEQGGLAVADLLLLSPFKHSSGLWYVNVEIFLGKRGCNCDYGKGPGFWIDVEWECSFGFHRRPASINL